MAYSRTSNLPTLSINLPVCVRARRFCCEAVALRFDCAFAGRRMKRKKFIRVVGMCVNVRRNYTIFYIKKQHPTGVLFFTNEETTYFLLFLRFVFVRLLALDFTVLFLDLALVAFFFFTMVSLGKK